MKQQLYEHVQNYVEKILVILAAYGIVQVLAQDIGLETGKRQQKFLKIKPVQILILYSTAYIVVDNHIAALIATILYLFLNI